MSWRPPLPPNGPARGLSPEEPLRCGNKCGKCGRKCGRPRALDEDCRGCAADRKKVRSIMDNLAAYRRADLGGWDGEL